MDAYAGRPRIHGPRSYQHQTLRGLLRGIPHKRGAMFTVLFPRQAGKNEVAAALVDALLWQHGAGGGSIIVAAPTFTPQALISLERTRALLERSAAVTSLAIRVESFTLAAGQARAIYLSASPTAHVAGHTASLALIADEAQEIERDWFERQFRPMAASTGAPTVLFGTPWDGNNILDQTVARNRARDLRADEWWRANEAPGKEPPVHLHYQASWEDVGNSNPPYRDYVETERARLGSDDPHFLSQYELRTVDAAGRLFSVEQLASLEGGHARLDAPLTGERYVAGLDVAGDGARSDASVLTIARVAAGPKCEVVRHYAWQGVPINVLEQGVAAAAAEWRLERLVVDGTGMGAAIVAHLARELPRVEVENFVFSTASKSELGFRVLGAASRGTLALYRDDGSREARECRAELRACERRTTSRRGIAWGNERGHDDYVTSLALCLLAAEESGVPRFATGRRRD